MRMWLSWLSMLGLLLVGGAQAATYSFNVGTINTANPAVSGSPSICSGSWTRTGSSGAYVFTCNGNISTASGDVLTNSANSSITAVASNTISLNASTVGTATRLITLQTSYGSLTSTGTNTIYGSVISDSGAINLAGTTLSGSVTGTGAASLSGGSVAGSVSVSGNVTTNGTAIAGSLTSNYGTLNLTGGSVGGNVSTGGAVTASGTTLGGTLTSGGAINLSGGIVTGLVRSTCCALTTNGVNLLSGARSDSSSVSITGGSIAGVFYANNNTMSFSGVTMTSGSVSGASTITFSDSTLGSAASLVNITSVSGPVTLNNTTVFGDLTAPTYSTIYVNSPSSVSGTCTPGSVPANACKQLPLLNWSLDQASWTGAADEVLDSSGNALNGSVLNGATTATSSPALTQVNAQGTCGYGSFNSSASQYVQRADNNLLDLQGSFSVGVWVKPRTLPTSGLMTILSKDTNYEFHLNPNGTVNWWWQTTSPSGTGTFNSTVALAAGQWSHVLIRYAPGDQRIYINGNLAGQASFAGTPVSNSLPLQLGADQNFAGRYFNGELDEVRIYDSALAPSTITELVAERHLCALNLQCFNDNFDRASLGSDWAVASRGSTTFTPLISSARMRLTSNQGNVATSSTLQRLFPAAGNYIQLQFKHFAYSGSGADGMAIVLSDASVTPQPGAFGGPLGYGTRGNAASPGFAGGWLGVGIDEFGNFSTEGGPGGPGRRLDSVALRGSGSVASGYAYIAGTAANLNPGVDSASSTTAAPGHTYRLTVDGRFTNEARVTVERDSGAGFVVLPNLSAVNVLAVAGQASLPTDFYLSLTGSTGGATNIHELDDLQVCATNINPLTAQVDHFEFSYASSALTCNPQTVTVRACQDASCSALFTDPVSVTLTPSSGWSATAPATVSGGNVLSFSGGSAVAQVRSSSVGTLNLSVQSSVPSTKANSQTLCSTSSCAISFADSGLLLTVPNVLAAKSTAATISAVRKADNALLCVPAFANVSRSISFTSAYSNPTTGTKPVVINGSNLNASLNLAFDAKGTAPLTVRYDDAGLMTLTASYTGTAANADAGLLMSGSTQFVSKPYGLLLQTDTSSSCSVADLSCPLFPGGVRAGDPFALRVSAVAWQSDGEPLTAAALADNSVTPNFQLGNIGLTAALQGPVGGVNGSISPLLYSHVLGSQTSVSAQISEVGIFSLSATPTALSYFGETVSGGTSKLVGRFIPAYLGAAGSASLTPSCGTAFSYQGQPISFASAREPNLIVTGYNRAGAVTRNYDRGSFWRLNTPAVGTYTSITAVANRDARLLSQGTASTATNGSDDGDGARSYRWSGQTLTYTPAALPSSDDYPFAAKIQQSFAASALTDADGACYGGGASCQAYSYDFTDNPGSQVQLGRLRIGNAHGSELQGLSLPLTLESWQNVAAGSFQLQAADTCSTSAVLGTPTLSAYSGNLAAGETVASVTGPSNGLGLLALSAPGSGNDGTLQGRLSTLPAWLYYDWEGSGRIPAWGLASFGIYQGATPLIFRREMYR